LHAFEFFDELGDIPVIDTQKLVNSSHTLAYELKPPGYNGTLHS